MDPNSMRCQSCGQQVTAYCNSHAIALGFCAQCFANHKRAHSDKHSLSMMTPESDESECTVCRNAGIWFCVRKEEYYCDRHRDSHCQNCELYPAKKAYELNQTQQGRGRLRRLLTIYAAESFLADQMSGLEARLVAELEQEFQHMIQFVEAVKFETMTQITARVKELREEMQPYLERLGKFKKDESLEPGNNLESLILTQDHSEVLRKLEKTAWLRVSLRSCVKPQLDQLFQIERCEDLLEDSNSACDWAFKYMLVPGSPAHFWLLESTELSPCSFTVHARPGVVWTSLPDGKICTVGNHEDLKICVIDKNFTTYRQVSRLQKGRSFSGLAFLPNSLYIFGGGNKQFIESSAEILDMKTMKCTLLPTKMNTPRHNFCPCVWNQKVFLAGGRSSNLFELFDPQTCVFTLTARWLSNIDPVLAIYLNEETILIIGQGILAYHPNKELVETISDDVIKVKTQAHPIYYNESVYFTLRGSEDEPVTVFAKISLADRQLTKIFSTKG